MSSKSSHIVTFTLKWIVEGKVWASYPPCHRLNSTTTVLLQGWLSHWMTLKSWYTIKTKKTKKKKPNKKRRFFIKKKKLGSVLISAAHIEGMKSISWFLHTKIWTIPLLMWVGLDATRERSFLGLWMNVNQGNNIYICMYLPNSSARAECDTKSVFKWGLTGLNSETSLPLTGWHTKVKEPNLPYYLHITGRRIVGFTLFPRALVFIIDSLPYQS